MKTGAIAKPVMAIFVIAGFAFQAIAADIAVVAPDGGFGLSLGRHVTRWLGGLGVKSDMVKYGTANAYRGKKLVYAVMPKDGDVAALGAYLARGGKVFVFYSDSAKLATMMGMRLGAYRKADGALNFSGIVFNKTAPTGSPNKIVQSSANIFRVEAVAGKSRQIAYWVDRGGKPTGDAAILASNHGWWMTHVMLADGDEQAKAQFLASVAGASVPGSWNYAKFAAAKKSAQTADRAYALAQKPRQGEIRAVWEHSGQGLYPGDWGRTIRELTRYGITDLFVNVGGAGFAHYPSAVLPPSNTYATSGDQLAACLRAARGSGIRVHAWIMCFNGTRGTPGRLEQFAKKGWRLKSKTGQLTEYLNPSKADLRKYLLDAIGEVAKKYQVAGVHLDFVRWYEGSKLPPDAAKHTGMFVAQARNRVKTERPDAIFSTAVFGKYPSCVKAVGQDWRSWEETGLVDFVVPMNYLEDNVKFSQIVQEQCAKPRNARRTICGIGVTAIESRLGVRQVIDQVNIARSNGAAGVAFFDLDYTLVNDILPYLRLGLFKAKGTGK